MRDTTSGWTLEDEAAAGAIGGHAGTHHGQGLASGDTLGGTIDAALEDLDETGPVPDDEDEPVGTVRSVT